jgi:nucleoside-diphosphate-sugar epimerase
MAIAILGASGEIGARLAQHCVVNKIPVRLIVRSIDPRMARWANVDIRKVDIANPDTLKEALNGCSAVINCALDKSGLEDEEQNIQRNKTFFTNLVKFCIELGIGKLIELSSIAVLPPKVTADVLKDDYGYSKEPDWYTKVKITTEQIALEYKDRLDITIIRPGIVYGPYMHWSKLAFIRTSRHTLALPDAANSTCHAIYVDDLVDLMLFAADIANKTPVLLYGVNPEPVSWKDFFDMHALPTGNNAKPTVLLAEKEFAYLQKVEGDIMKKPGLKRVMIDTTHSVINSMPGLVKQSKPYQGVVKKLKAINYGLLNYDNYLSPPKVVSLPLFMPNSFEVELFSTSAIPPDNKLGISLGFKYKTGIKEGAKNAAMWWKYRL